MPSKSKKYVLGACVDASRYSAFQNLAGERELSKSCLLGLLIDDFLKLTPTISPVSTAPNEKKLMGVWVRLSPFQHAELRRLAVICHWHPSTYLRRLLDAHLTARPQFNDAELHALRQVAGQIADLGRNINQIARALNTSVDNAHLAMAVPFGEIKTLLDLERTFINKLASGSLAWGVNDGK